MMKHVKTSQTGREKFAEQCQGPGSATQRGSLPTPSHDHVLSRVSESLSAELLAMAAEWQVAKRRLV